MNRGRLNNSNGRPAVPADNHTSHADSRGNQGGTTSNAANNNNSHSTRRFNPYLKRSSAPSSALRIKTTSFAIPSDSSPAACTPTSTDLDALIWLQYFPNEKHSIGSSLDTKLRAMQAFVDRNGPQLFDWPAVQRQHIAPLYAKTLTENAALLKVWPTINADLSEHPDETLYCLAYVLHKHIVRLPIPSQSSASQMSTAATGTATLLNVCLRRVHIRLEDSGLRISLRSLKVCHYGRLITLRGTVIRVASVRLLCTWLAFRCASCQAEQIVLQPDGRMQMPTRCLASDCRAQSAFEPQLASLYTRTESQQTIRLQESMQGTQFDAGYVPRAIELELNCDLVGTLSPGDDVLVTGIMKVHPDEAAAVAAATANGGGTKSGHRKQPTASLHHMYVEALSVSCDKNVQQKIRHNDFTVSDMEAIEQIRQEPSVLRLMVHSLCPGIYGHEIVKAGLILGLFGASGNGSSNVSVTQKRRSESHVLVVGDPGMGKSQMLQACARVSPRGIFVCGNSSSNAGLAVSVRQERGGGSALEAGALVLADQGCCCIDEFDKMQANHEALLEAMEEQRISVAKAGVLCSLPARTCILAAANPAGGHYNHGRTLLQNLKLNEALLSRFDLVFVLLDRPDEHTDRLMTAHITAMYGSSEDRASSKDTATAWTQDASQPSKQTLKAQLRLGHNEQIDHMPHILMQKYIAYARKYVRPTLSVAAAAELKAFYLQERAAPRSANATPITTRRLEALVRLTQARARVDLCRQATSAHALDVIEIVQMCMADELRNSTGGSGPGASVRLADGTKPLSQATQLKRLLAALRRRSELEGHTVFTTDEIEDTAATVPGLGGISIGQLVDILNMQGALLKKGQRMYKLLME